jgi:hypothetical protein
MIRSLIFTSFAAVRSGMVLIIFQVADNKTEFFGCVIVSIEPPILNEMRDRSHIGAHHVASVRYLSSVHLIDHVQHCENMIRPKYS